MPPPPPASGDAVTTSIISTNPPNDCADQPNAMYPFRSFSTNTFSPPFPPPKWNENLIASRLFYLNLRTGSRKILSFLVEARQIFRHRCERLKSKRENSDRLIIRGKSSQFVRLNSRCVIKRGLIFDRIETNEHGRWLHIIIIISIDAKKRKGSDYWAERKRDSIGFF